MVRCGDNCKWPEHSSATKRLICRDKRSCTCEVCGSLQSIDLNLFEGCAAMCNAETAEGRPKNVKDFWATMDPNDVWRRYKIQIGDFDPNKTVEAVQAREKQERIDKQTASQQDLTKKMLTGVGTIVLIFLIIKLLRG